MPARLPQAPARQACLDLLQPEILQHAGVDGVTLTRDQVKCSPAYPGATLLGEHNVMWLLMPTTPGRWRTHSKASWRW